VTGRGVFVHSHGLCEADDVGEGTRIWAFAHVLAGAVIGADCNIGDHSFVEAGARLGRNVTVKNGVSIWSGVTLDDDVFVGPNAAFTNDLRPRAAIKRPESEFLPTHVQRGATLGANATVVCGVTVGAHAFVAAGAVVVRDVPAHALVAGNPARRFGWACTCGSTLPDSLQCTGCGRSFELAGETEGLVATPAPGG
jgi:acetyltransferase-like isoleucine patch superfamily enzyme